MQELHRGYIGDFRRLHFSVVGRQYIDPCGLISQGQLGSWDSAPAFQVWTVCESLVGLPYTQNPNKALNPKARDGKALNPKPKTLKPQSPNPESAKTPSPKP